MDDDHFGTPQDGKVCVANYPLAFFAEKLGGDALEVVFLAPEDGDPAFWQPDDEAIAEFQSAHVILMNGAGYSRWTETVSLPTSRVVNTSAAFAHAYIEVKEAISHSHGPGGEHAHGGTAFTTWLDFQQAIQQMEAVREALEPLLMEEDKAGMREREAALMAALEGLDKRLLAVGERLKGRPLMGSHPVYQYLSRRYGLNLREVHWEPDEAPDEDALAELKEILRDHPATVMIWEGEPLPESVRMLKDMGLASVVFDPSGNRPESGDFLTVMESNVAAMEALAN